MNCGGPIIYYADMARHPSTNDRDPRLKVWNALRTSMPNPRIESTRIINSPIFAPQTIEFGAATVLTGSHGAGKSALLAQVAASFGSAGYSDILPFIKDSAIKLPHDREFYLDGTFEVAIHSGGHRYQSVVDLGMTSDQRRSLWTHDSEDKAIDVTHANPALATGNLALLEQFYPEPPGTHRTKLVHSYTTAELRVLRNILGRNYESATVYGISMAEPNDVPAYPYDHLQLVEAFVEGRRITTVRMSQGELWVHWLLGWAMFHAPRGALVLIDEPEAFLAPRAHRFLIDEIARRALANCNQLIVATHSPDVIGRFPPQGILACIRSADGIRAIRPTSLAQVNDLIGIRAPVRAVVMTEDPLARHLIRVIVGDCDPSLLGDLEIVPSGGAAGVVAGVRALRNAERLGVIGVLDGDQRGKNHSGVDGKIAFLPGHQEPEAELVRAAGGNAARVASALRRSEPDIYVALDTCRELDHQYQLRRIAEHLARDEEVVLHALVDTWLDDPAVRQQAEDLVEAIRGAADR